MKSLSAIAREMGVSSATVSYVYHGKWREKRIRPELAARIQRKLRQERAHPDMLGQQLRSGLTRTAGVLLPNFDQPYFLRLLAGLERRLSQDDYMLFLGHAYRRGQRRPQFRHLEPLERMLARRVDMVIFSPVPTDDLPDALAQVRRLSVPTVFIDSYLPGAGIPYVASDNRWGAAQAVSRALADGRRRVAFAGGTPRNAALADRCAGYRAALAKAGVTPPDEWILWREQFGGVSAQQAALRALLAQPDRPEAIFSDSLFGCRWIVETLAQLGLRHPDDVLLCGFDSPDAGPETVAFSQTIRSPLLTVQQDAETMGALAAEMALRASRGRGAPRSRLIRPTLVWETLPGTAADAAAPAGAISPGASAISRRRPTAERKTR